MNTDEENQDSRSVRTKEEASRKEARIVVSVEAEAAVTDFTEAVNQGFDAGAATRFDVASFMILWFKANAPNDVIFEMRKACSDTLSMLDAVRKQAKKSGDLPPEIKSALEQYFFGNAALVPKKAKKNLKQESLNERLHESET